MTHIKIGGDPVLVAGAHVEADAVLEIGVDIDAEDAAQLVRLGRAAAHDAEAVAESAEAPKPRKRAAASA